MMLQRTVSKGQVVYQNNSEYTSQIRTSGLKCALGLHKNTGLFSLERQYRKYISHDKHIINLVMMTIVAFDLFTYTGRVHLCQSSKQHWVINK